MQIPAGTLLMSTSTQEGDFFERAVVLITEENENGHTGFVVNKYFPRKLNELMEFNDSAPFPLYDGGPVGKNQLFFLHQRSDLIDGGMPVKDSVFWGGNFTQAVRYINLNMLTEQDLRIFIGYCGWSTGQLEKEFLNGYWKINRSPLRDIIYADATMLWYTLL